MKRLSVVAAIAAKLAMTLLAPLTAARRECDR